MESTSAVGFSNRYDLTMMKYLEFNIYLHRHHCTLNPWWFSLWHNKIANLYSCINICLTSIGIITTINQYRYTKHHQSILVHKAPKQWQSINHCIINNNNNQYAYILSINTIWIFNSNVTQLTVTHYQNWIFSNNSTVALFPPAGISIINNEFSLTYRNFNK